MKYALTNQSRKGSLVLPLLTAAALLSLAPLGGCQKRASNNLGKVGVTTASGAAIGSLSGNAGKGAATGAVAGLGAILIQELFSGSGE